MSVRNGDKARFGRLRKQKILLRKRLREMREVMENRPARTSIALSKEDDTMSLPLKPVA